jgi:hypothetical protein
VKRQRQAVTVEESVDFSVALSSVDRSRAGGNPESSEYLTVGGGYRRAIDPVQVKRLRGRFAVAGGGQTRDSKKWRAIATAADSPRTIVERQEHDGSTRAVDTKLPAHLADHGAWDLHASAATGGALTGIAFSSALRPGGTVRCARNGGVAYRACDSPRLGGA